MIWNGKDLATIGDLSDAVLSIIRTGTREDAARFMAEYRAENEHADANIGYLSGYYDPERMAKVQEWFGVAHPIFGKRTDVSADEAFMAGERWAKGEKL